MSNLVLLNAMRACNSDSDLINVVYRVVEKMAIIMNRSNKPTCRHQ